jgi:hypothetical protein
MFIVLALGIYLFVYHHQANLIKPFATWHYKLAWLAVAKISNLAYSLNVIMYIYFSNVRYYPYL